MPIWNVTRLVVSPLAVDNSGRYPTLTDTVSIVVIFKVGRIIGEMPFTFLTPMAAYPVTKPILMPTFALMPFAISISFVWILVAA